MQGLVKEPDTSEGYSSSWQCKIMKAKYLNILAHKRQIAKSWGKKKKRKWKGFCFKHETKYMFVFWRGSNICSVQIIGPLQTIWSCDRIQQSVSTRGWILSACRVVVDGTNRSELSYEHSMGLYHTREHGHKIQILCLISQNLDRRESSHF